MGNIEIRKVSINDIIQLQEISKRTFFETYSLLNTEENMSKYLNENFSLEKLSAELHNNNSEFYFAFHNNDIIGYLKLNKAQAQTDLKDNNSLEIERIYVLQAFQGKKVGKLFYEKAIQIAKQIDVEYIWLGVWEENPKAINFYKKNGFVEFDKHIFKLGNDEQKDILMKLQIRN